MTEQALLTRNNEGVGPDVAANAATVGLNDVPPVTSCTEALLRDGGNEVETSLLSFIIIFQSFKESLHLSFACMSAL